MTDTPGLAPDTPRVHAVDDLADGESLRARKKKLTRRAIHEAALHLVADRGLDHVTAEEIAATAGVSARTFFNYFPTKDAAVLGLPPDLPDLLGRSLLDRPAHEDLFTALTAIVRGWFVRMDEDPLRDTRRAVVGRDPRLGAAMVGANREVEATLVHTAAEREARRGTRSPGEAHGDLEDLWIRITVSSVISAARATYMHVQQHAGTHDPSTQGRRFAEALTEAFHLLATGLDTRATAPTA